MLQYFTVLYDTLYLTIILITCTVNDCNQLIFVYMSDGIVPYNELRGDWMWRHAFTVVRKCKPLHANVDYGPVTSVAS